MWKTQILLYLEPICRSLDFEISKIRRELVKTALNRHFHRKPLHRCRSGFVLSGQRDRGEGRSWRELLEKRNKGMKEAAEFSLVLTKYLLLFSFFINVLLLSLFTHYNLISPELTVLISKPPPLNWTVLKLRRSVIRRPCTKSMSVRTGVQAYLSSRTRKVEPGRRSLTSNFHFLN